MAITYLPPVVMDGLQLYLDAANTKSYPGSGTAWNDLSGNGNNGTLVNGVGYSTDGLGSLTFDGVDDYVNVGDKFDNIAATICFWVKLTNSISVPSTQNQRPWGKNGNFEARWGGNGDTTLDASLIVDISASPVNPIVSVQNSWSNTVWYNIVLSYNGSNNTSQLYVQGALDSTGQAGNVTGLTGDFNIGRSSATGGNLNGKIAQFSIYDRILTATEVAQNYNATKNRFGL